jgi:hypothetical protein
VIDDIPDPDVLDDIMWRDRRYDAADELLIVLDVLTFDDGGGPKSSRRAMTTASPCG